jgi:hypothetical protein
MKEKMNKKITQWAEQVSTSSQHAWGTLALVIGIPAIAILIIGMVTPTTPGAMAVFGLFLTLVGGFLGSITIAALTSWASKILGLEKQGFVRALGSTSLINIFLVPLQITLVILFALMALLPMIAPVIIIVYVAMIIGMILLGMFIFSKAYGITKGQAFGLASTAFGLFAVIVLSIIAVITFVLSFIIPTQLATMQDFQQVQMEAMMQSGDLQLDPASIVELQTALKDLQLPETLAEEVEL